MFKCPNGHDLQASIEVSDQAIYYQKGDKWTEDESFVLHNIQIFCPSGCVVDLDTDAKAEKSIRTQLELNEKSAIVRPS